MLKKIILIFLIIFSVNISFANNKINNTEILEKIKNKLKNTKYKNNITKIDKFLENLSIKKLQKINFQIKKIKIEKINNKNKQLLIAYIKIKIKEKIDIYNKKQKKLILEKEKLNKEKKKNYNGLDISKNLKYKHLQEMPLSCEISATSDILSNLLGKKISEKNLLKILDKSEFNKIATRKKGKKYWGNPQKGFVGYMNKLPNGRDAMQGYMTGYGVLEKPIAKIYKQYGFKTKIILDNNSDENYNSKNHLSLLLEELHKGNMVQMWGDICTNPKNYSGKETICKIRGKLSWAYKRELKWEYKDNNGKYKKYVGLNGEHAFYLLGYKGNYINPTHIIVWDTMTGKHTYPINEWMRKWGKMQNRSIIIYAK